ncbi:unnamed protein product [Xylocopa violacea]|uniref:MADF domain-containing protein n=1 Tax=Xylocopa violacea TaxID=135666 RepID=A0ABP1NH77_XYLVO
MSKWNERLVVRFLKAYKQYPCLWNPYDPNYYNCREKNNALQKIIDDLSIPGFTVTDYLHQIKNIREKYKQEQARTLKSLQSQKRYISPLPWYSILMDMLMKVIHDEERIHQGAPCTLECLGGDNIKNSEKQEKLSKTCPCNNMTSNQAFKRNKSMEKPSRLGGKRISIEKSTMQQSYVPTKDTDIDTGMMEYLAHAPSVSMDSKYISSSFLTNKNDKIYDSTRKNGAENYVPCFGYNTNLSDEINTVCTEYDNVTHDDESRQSKRITDLSEYMKMRMSNCEDFDILQGLLKRMSIGDWARKHPEIETIKRHMDAEVQYSEDMKKTSKVGISAAATIQTHNVQVDPAVVNKHGTIDASILLNIVLLEPNKDSKLNRFVEEHARNNAQSVQRVQPELSSKETQFSIENIVSDRRTTETGVNTIDCVAKEVQNTVCTSNGTKRCISVQTLYQSAKDESEKDTYHGKDSKEVAVNMIDQVSKGVQSIICVSRGNSACRMSSEKVVEIGTAMSVHEVRNIGCVTAENANEFKSIFVQCPLKEKSQSLPRSKSHDSLKRCVRNTDLKRPIDKERQGSDTPCTTNTCSLNISSLTRDDPTVALSLQQLLKKILSKREHKTQNKKSGTQIDHEYKYHPKGNCLIDTTEMVNAIKEYTTNIRDSKLTMTDEHSFEPVSRSTVMKKDKGLKTTEVDTLSAPETAMKVPVVDKEVCTRSDCKDVGTNGSYLRLICDAEIQSRYQALKDSVCSKYNTRETVSVGTQKRDPILVCVIKCNRNRAIVRLDKETLAVGKDFEKKCVKMCGRPTCIPTAVCRKSSDTCLKSALYKDRENQIASNYCRRSITFKDNICDKKCKGRNEHQRIFESY